MFLSWVRNWCYLLQYYRCFGVLKRRFPVLSKGITVNLSNIQAIIVACAVMHNICIDMHDDIPNDLCEDNYDGNVREENFFDLPGNTRGRQERDRVIRDHFANLQWDWTFIW